MISVNTYPWHGLLAKNLLWCFLTLGCLFSNRPATAGAFNHRPPTSLLFPTHVKPIVNDKSKWKKHDKIWTLATDAFGYLEAPVWWRGNRPPRGELAVLEIEYQDTLEHPVITEIYSGLNTSNRYSEIHRFGGLADGKWKNARIPASSDFIFRHVSTDTIRFRLRSSANTLTVRSFRLVAPQTNEEILYNAQTRAWVKREQNRATVAPRYYELAKPPILPRQWRDKPLVPFSRNWMDLVRPISTPQGGEAGAHLSARMFVNEHEPVQLGIYANKMDLENIRISVDPIKDASNKTLIETKIRVAEYAKVKGQLIPGYLVEPFPQRLWPAYPFDIPARRSHLVWIDLKTQENTTRPGVFTTHIHIHANGIDEVTVPLRIEILNHKLLSMEEAGLKFGGSISQLVPEFELAFLREYNHNMLNIWYLGVRPELSKDKDSFKMDFRIMDDWMAAAKRQKITDLVYFLGGDSAGFPRTLHLPRTLAATVLGLNDTEWSQLVFKNPNRLPKKVASLITEWSDRFSNHAQNNLWPNILLTPFDEPAKYTHYRTNLGMLSFIKPQFKQQIQLLRKGSHQTQIYGSIHEYYAGMDFLEDLDVFCTNAADENENMPDEVRAANKIFWEYSGTDDQGLPGDARYTFGFYYASHNSRGSLVWAYNWGKRFDTLDGHNWLYAWNTPFDVIPSPYMEGLREAWDDRRLLETYKQAAVQKGVDTSEFLQRLFADVANFHEKKDYRPDSRPQRRKREQAMDEWRDRMVNELIKLR